MSGLNGDNVAERGESMAWYGGPSLARASRQRAARRRRRCGESRSGCRCNGSTGPTRIFAASPGQIASGTIEPGAEVRILPSGRVTRVERIVTLDGDLDEAVAGQSVTLTLADEVDCSRGDVIAAAGDPPRGRRPVRSDDRVDGRRGAAAGPRLLAEARHADGHRDRPAAQI